MFIRNKYYRWYYQIVDRARRRGQPNEYYEKHHIIPACLGGINSEFNIVNLTYREHYIAHWLLTKMTVGKARQSMFYALFSMTGTPKINRKIKMTSRWLIRAGIIRGQLSKGRIHTKESRLKISQAAKSRDNSIKLNWHYKKHSEESKSKMSLSHRGKILSEDHIEKIRQKNTGKKRSLEFGLKMREINKSKVLQMSELGKSRKGTKHSEETKSKMSLSAKSRKRLPHSEESRLKMSLAHLARFKEKSGYTSCMKG